MATETDVKFVKVDVPMRVSTRNLMKGDRVGSGEVILGFQRSTTRKGYINVCLGLPNSDRKARWAEWNANSLIGITRQCVKAAE
jgi:hypothetical protein